MRCFSCFKSSKETKDSKGSWKCLKGSSSEEEDVRLRRSKGRGICCFCGGKPSKDEEPLTKKRSSCCFFCVESSKDDEPLRKRREWCMGGLCCNGSTKDEELPKKEGKDGMSCCFSCNNRSSEVPLRKRRKCGMCCFSCNKQSLEETSSTKEKGGMCCFSSNKCSSEKSPRQKGKCGMSCLSCKKRSSDESLRREGECCVSCFCCCKSSKKEESRGCEEEATNGFPHAKSTEKKTGCLPCLKSSKRSTTKPPKGKSSKWSILNMLSCLRCCTCCSSKRASKKRKKSSKKKILCWKRKEKRVATHLESLAKSISFKSESEKHRSAAEEILRIGNGITEARVFTYAELTAATQNFKPERQLAEGGFGRIYQGQLEDTKQVIAVKQLDKNGNQGNKEFLTEVLMLSLLNHPNLVNLLGYCADGDEKLIVYEYMPLGSLQDHLFDLSPNSKPLDWITRMKIAAGVAKGLQYLHEIANPPVIHRDLKASNILLDEEFNPKLSDLGISKIGPVGDKNHVTTRVMGTCGYYAPEYALTGQLTKMSDIYSLGVVLLELITGRKAMDPARPRNERMLLDWAVPLFNDKQRFDQMADPLLQGNFPIRALYQALAVATMCIEEEDTKRPQIKDIVSALNYLTTPSCEKPVKRQEEYFSQDPVAPDLHIRSSSDESTQSSYSDWQSCSTIREDEEDMIVISL